MRRQITLLALVSVFVALIAMPDLHITANAQSDVDQLHVYLPLVQTQSSGVIPKSTYRVSIASDGSEGNDRSGNPSISADGRFIAFDSLASNLVEDDTNGTYDVFVRDRVTHQTALVSVASDGSSGNNASLHPSISRDGRFVAFMSDASNLVEDDTNDTYDVFLHDRETHQTILLSVATDGSVGNDLSGFPSISDDGRLIAFHSRSSNLVVDDRDSGWDVFVYDRLTRKLASVSLALKYASSYPNISADGRFVAFLAHVAQNTDETNTFVYDLQMQQLVNVSRAADGIYVSRSGTPSISGDGRFVAFLSDPFEHPGVSVYDRQGDNITHIGVEPNGDWPGGESAAPSISDDGRFITFRCGNNYGNRERCDKESVYVYDGETGNITLVSVATNVDPMHGLRGRSLHPSISGDGRFIAFESTGSNLVSNDSNDEMDVFVHDRGTTSP